MLLLTVAVTSALLLSTARGDDDCLKHEVDYLGDDMENGYMKNVSSAEDCQRHCQQRSGCRFFVWSTPNDTGCPNCLQCWLKTNSSNPQPNKWHISGPANCHLPDPSQRQERVIFFEEFDQLNETRWQHLVTGWRGGNNEFQYYRNNRSNSYVSKGILYIKPSFTAAEFGKDFLYNGSLNLWEQGCQPDMNIDGGCHISAGVDILNPIQSARLRTINSFSFKYGRMEVSARMPRGDWLWPAIWLLPQDWKYGGWPLSGEIDLVETRGNPDLSCGGKHLGNKRMGSTLHWGPSPGQNRWDLTSWIKDDPTNPYSESFHKYELEWSDSHIAFKVDGALIGETKIPAGGFWELGKFGGNNIWDSGNRMAPFDQNFHIILNLAVGGDFFPDGCSNGANGAKPWVKGSSTSMRNFWEHRDDWEKTWGEVGSDQSALQIDYIRVYQRA